MTHGGEKNQLIKHSSHCKLEPIAAFNKKHYYSRLPTLSTAQ